MDEMKIVSKFTNAIIAKVIKKLIRKKLGYNVNLQFNEITAIIVDGKAQVHLNADAELEKDELTKLLKAVGLN